jgi:pyruvate dehydrogenase E2 component (dihydrolipoamide acetyltransferase)
MTEEIFLPRMGSTTMSHAVLLEWLVQEGDFVERDQPVAEVETDKTNLEVPAPADGRVLRLLAQPGDEIPVGGVLGYLGEPGENTPAPPTSVADVTPAPAATPSPPAPALPAPAMVTGTEATAPPSVVRASPAARRRARELGVDLGTVTGTGPDGRIRTVDIEAAATGAAVPVTPAPPTGPAVTATASVAAAPTAANGRRSRQDRVRRLRQITARRMSEAARQVPAVTLTREVDVQSTQGAIQAARRDGEARPGLLDFVIAAAARALVKHPVLNSRYKEDENVSPGEDVNIGFAVQAEVGLLVPTLTRVQGLSPAEIWARRRALTEQALADRLTVDALAPATFTVSNLGPFGVDVFTPIVNLPQVAILGVGRVRQGISVVDGQPAVRDLAWLSLTFDHRAVDGAPAAAFLAEVAEELE